MARYEIIGLYDCPWFAKAEKLVEEIQLQFPIVEFHKSMKDRFQWNDYITHLKQTRGWTIKRSPVIYEVLVEPKGKAVLIGDIDDFCEYVQAFFGILSDCKESVLLQDQVVVNRALFAKGFEGQDRGTKNICNLAIINAPLKMLECLLPQLLSHFCIAPPSILFRIKLFSYTMTPKELEGICMEATDLASVILFQITASTTLTEVLYDAHVVLMLDDLGLRVEENTSEWLTRVEWTIIRYSEQINEVAGDNCRVLVGCEGPLCYIAELFRNHLRMKKVQRGHIVTIGQHIVTQAKSVISQKAELSPGCISRLHAWGWPGLVGAYVEVRDGIYKDGDFSIQGPSPCEIPLAQIALNPTWIFKKFAEEFLFSQRERIFKTNSFHPTHMCMAEAVVSTLHIWLMSSSTHGPIPGFRISETCCESKIPPSSGGTATTSYFSRNSGQSRPATNQTTSSSASGSYVPEELILPVISAGVECSKQSSFPRGTFMVQPAVCYYGKWIPAGKISEHTNTTILKEVNKLWLDRLNLIHRDKMSVESLDYERLYGQNQAMPEDEVYGEAGYYGPLSTGTKTRQPTTGTGNDGDVDTN